MAQNFSVKTLKFSFDDISKSADIQSWQLVATDVQSLSASKEKSCRPQLMIVVNLSFRLGFKTELSEGRGKGGRGRSLSPGEREGSRGLDEDGRDVRSRVADVRPHTGTS